MSKVDIHKRICEELNALYARKNADYGDSFGKSFKEYGLTMACIRLEDKLNRIKALRTREAQVADESVIDTITDLANYAIMTLVEMRVDEPVMAENDFEEIVDEFPDLPKVGDHDRACQMGYALCLCNTCRRDNTNSNKPSCCDKHKINCSDWYDGLNYCPDYVPDCMSEEDDTE